MPTYKRATSRRAKRERRQALKRTVILILVAFGLFFMFIFGVIPLSLKALDLMDKGQNQVSSDTIPPSVPNLSVPFTVTNLARIKVSGFTEPKAKVIIWVNGQQEAELVADDDGQFETKVTLTPGDNEIKAQAYDKAGNESQPSSVKKVLYDNQTPKIEFSNVENDQEIIGKQNKNFILEGETEPRAKVYINNRFVYADEEGKFRFSLTLNEGDNPLKVRVVDQAKNKFETELNIKFKP